MSIQDGHTAVMLRCWGCQATVAELCEAIGVKVSDLFLVPRGEVYPEVKQRLKNESRLEWLEQRELECIANQYFYNTERRRHWQAIEVAVKKERQELWDLMHPESADKRKRMEKFHAAVRKFGWDRVIEKFEQTDKGKALIKVYGRKQ